MEQAVRLLTSRSAEVFGLSDRGRLALGIAGDVAVFDPDTVGCSPLRRVRDLPAGADRLIADATGIRAVIVNGVVLREDGQRRGRSRGPAAGSDPARERRAQHGELSQQREGDVRRDQERHRV